MSAKPQPERNLGLFASTEDPANGHRPPVSEPIGGIGRVEGNPPETLGESPGKTRQDVSSVAGETSQERDEPQHLRSRSGEETAAVERERDMFRAALVEIADANSGRWGWVAHDALKKARQWRELEEKADRILEGSDG